MPMTTRTKRSAALAEARQQVAALKHATLRREQIKVDESLYPRYKEDSTVIAQYAEAKRAGAKFPAIKVDQKFRLIDGIHRLRADDINGVKVIEVEIEYVKDDVDFFRQAMTANAHHGRRYSAIDYAHMLLRGRELGLKDEDIASLVYVTPEFLNEVTRDWFALNSKSEQVALKRTIRHMHGRKLTSDQLEANKRISGMQPAFYMNQIMMLLDNDLIDTENLKVIENLNRLQESLANFFLKLAKYGKTKPTS